MLDRAMSLVRHASVLAREQLLALRRSTRRQMGMSLALGLVASVATGAVLADLASASAGLGRRVPVVVATSQLSPGDVVSWSSFAVRSLPAIALPATAVRDLPVGDTLRQHLAPGEVLTAADLAVDGTAIPVGWRTVAIRSGGALPPLEPGARVDVIAASVVLVAGAIVIGVGDDGIVVVSVPAESAPSVATAAANGEATLVGGG